MFSWFSIFLSTALFLCCAHQAHVMCKHLISALLHYLHSLYITFTAFTLPLQPLPYLYSLYITFTAFTLPLQPFPLSPLIFRHACQTPARQPQTSWISHFLTLRSPQLERSPPRHQALCYSLPSKANSKYVSSRNTSTKQHCPSHLLVCTMTVCACVCSDI